MTESNDTKTESNAVSTSERRRIHPIVIYPFTQPDDTSHLISLYNFLSSLDSTIYFKPITVLNRQTIDNVIRNPSLSRDDQDLAEKSFEEFLDRVVRPVSEIKPSWCVDTCQMWLAGFGYASDANDALGAVYWLIPGDFHYNSASGRDVLKKIEEIPQSVYKDSSRVDLAIGEIQVDLNSAKQLIDTYGTYGLLYNWFPSEAQGIRGLTDKPRSEFLAISDSFLKYALSRRWYGYEQTIVLLLHAFSGKTMMRPIKRVMLGSITDEEAGRGRLGGAMQQLERSERVMKLYWREKHQDDSDWRARFRMLDSQSEKIRSSAMVIFEQVLN